MCARAARRTAPFARRRKLAPEGQVRELDVPASRCIAVKASLVARTPDADKEVWDIFDSEPFANDDELD
jgi:hypothetical protein